MTIEKEVKRLAQRAREASSVLGTLKTGAKNRALEAMAGAIELNAAMILEANAEDVRRARGRGLQPSLIARLALDDAKLRKVADSVRQIAKLPDPVGRPLLERKRPNGLRIRKVSVPIGTILIIYESRPNVTADCMALCLKSGNAVILKGGSEAFESNRAIFRTMDEAARKKGIPAGAFEFVPTGDRAAVKTLLGLTGTIDLVIPRGGEGLIRDVAENSRIPVIKHYKGVCHVFVDRKADFSKAESIVLNAKIQNPAACNALETLLVHRDAAKSFLPRICAALAEKGVEIRADKSTRALVSGVKAATEEDWHAEYLDMVLAVRVVPDIEAAIAHIRKYGSMHSDAIVTRDKKAAATFVSKVESACVFVNCSTRFNDGGEFGMGAEMGISTDKLHARGPMGLEELTTYKYVVTGNGQVRK